MDLQQQRMVVPVQEVSEAAWRQLSKHHPRYLQKVIPVARERAGLDPGQELRDREATRYTRPPAAVMPVLRMQAWRMRGQWVRLIMKL